MLQSMERQKLGGKNYSGKSLNGSKSKPPKKNSHILPYQNHDSGKERFGNHFDAVSDDFSSFSRPQGVESVHCDAQSCNGIEEAGFLNLEERVSFSLDFKSKREIHDLKTKLEHELSMVRNLMRRIDRNSSTNLSADDGIRVGRVKRAHSEIEVDGSESRQFPANMPAGKNNRVGTKGKAEKGMRTPMASQSQKCSDVNFSKEKIPPNQAKKSKLNGKKHGEQSFSLFGMGNSSSKVFKSCCSLLDKLMKQRDGWVFNTPVDAEGLGLYDYFTVIRNPMDLGTVKSRLTTNWYKTPEEFAEDVRLTFQNAIKYNMEGHEVNTLARQFLKMFEDIWVDIQEDYLRKLNVAVNSEADVPARTPAMAPTAAPKRAPPTPISSPQPPPPPIDIPMNVDLTETVRNQPVPEAKTANSVASGRARLPKPKAKDPNKRDMTTQEKQKLSANLQSLPPEKLEGVVRIIKKRNQSLSQNDDEIEVDIDSVDTETLWELDRFVIYYKKSLSKMKRSAELGEIGQEVEHILQEKDEAGSAILAAKENETDERNTCSSPSNEGGKPAGNASLSDDSSSSSSDSGSSSSDSDTDSSSS